MENNKAWYEEYDKNKPIMWVCEKCKKEIPSGIVNIIEHWDECVGRGFRLELEEKIKDPEFDVKALKKLQKKHFGKSKRS